MAWRKGPQLYLTRDPARGLALVRGPNARQACDRLGITARWSHTGRGLLVDLAHVPDLVADAEYERVLYVVSDRKEPDA